MKKEKGAIKLSVKYNKEILIPLEKKTINKPENKIYIRLRMKMALILAHILQDDDNNAIKLNLRKDKRIRGETNIHNRTN